MFILDEKMGMGRNGAVVSVVDYGPRWSLVRDLARWSFVVALSTLALWRCGLEHDRL